MVMGPLTKYFLFLKNAPGQKPFDPNFHDPNFPRNSANTDERAHASLVLEKAQDPKKTKIHQRLHPPPPQKKGPPASLYLAPPQEKSQSAASPHLFPPQGKCLASISARSGTMTWTSKGFKVRKGSGQKEKAAKTPSALSKCTRPRQD